MTPGNIDRLIPFSDGAVWIYLSIYLLMPIGPFLMQTNKDILRYAKGVLLIGFIADLVFLFWPTVCPRLGIRGTNAGYQFLIGLDSPFHALPSLRAETARTSAPCFVSIRASPMRRVTTPASILHTAASADDEANQATQMLERTVNKRRIVRSRARSIADKRSIDDLRALAESANAAFRHHRSRILFLSRSLSCAFGHHPDRTLVAAATARPCSFVGSAGTSKNLAPAGACCAAPGPASSATVAAPALDPAANRKFRRLVRARDGNMPSLHSHSCSIALCER